MRKKNPGLSFLALLALLSPLGLSNAPAPTYPEISHDDYAYSCEMEYLGDAEQIHYYSFSISNDSDYDMEPLGIIVRAGDTTMQTSYSLGDIFLPRHSKMLPTVFSIYSDTFWTNDKPSEMTISLTGALSQGAITEAGDETFTSPSSSVNLTYATQFPYRGNAFTSLTDLAVHDKVSSYYVRQYAYKDGSIVSFRGYRQWSDVNSNDPLKVDFYDPDEHYKKEDFTYLKTYRLAEDPNKTSYNPSHYNGIVAILYILLATVGVGVIVAILAVVIVAMVKVCQRA
jgi:hypothetical protein